MGKRLMAIFLCGALLSGVLAGLGAALPVLCQPLEILMYHNLVADGEAVEGMTVTASRFREDLELLHERGYTTVLPRELLNGERPEKPVMITFDDGYASNYTLLFPILRETGAKAAIALVGKLLDSGDESFLNWDMCREMQESGLVEFGSHSYDLHNLDGREGMYVEDAANGIQHMADENRGAYEARLTADLDRSIQEIRRELGMPVTYLAYPFGATDPWAEALVRERFAMTLCTTPGAADLARGRYSLPRRTVSMERDVSYYCP